MLNGKLNIIFGFIYFACTAILGPAVLVPGKGANYNLAVEAGKSIQTASNIDTSTMTVEKVNALSNAQVATARAMQAEKKLGFIGSTAHAHGNLEAMLNIVVGLVLIGLAIPMTFKKLLSILFIVGALCHSGVLYLASVFGIAALTSFTAVGAIAIVAGLLLMGIAAIIGLKDGPETVE